MQLLTFTRIVISLFCVQALASPMTVVVDPGHGGRDDGAERGGFKESEITLAVSRHLAELLKRDPRFRVHLTRDSDQTLSLLERARIAKQRAGDVFVSIHVNSNPDPKARGAEFYFQNQLAPDEESMLLAHRENATDEETGRAVPYTFIETRRMAPEVAAIVSDLLDSDRVLRSSQLSKALKQNWQGSRKSKSQSIRQAPFYVLSQMAIPSSLVELGFITNKDEQMELTSKAVQERMARDLYRGLIAYKESMDKSATNP